MSQIKEITTIIKQMGDVLAGREVSMEEIKEEWNKSHKDEKFEKVITKLKELVNDDKSKAINNNANNDTKVDYSKFGEFDLDRELTDYEVEHFDDFMKVK